MSLDLRFDLQRVVVGFIVKSRVFRDTHLHTWPDILNGRFGELLDLREHADEGMRVIRFERVAEATSELGEFKKVVDFRGEVHLN